MWRASPTRGRRWGDAGGHKPLSLGSGRLDRPAGNAANAALSPRALRLFHPPYSSHRLGPLQRPRRAAQVRVAGSKNGNPSAQPSPAPQHSRAGLSHGRDSWRARRARADQIPRGGTAVRSRSGPAGLRCALSEPGSPSLPPEPLCVSRPTKEGAAPRRPGFWGSLETSRPRCGGAVMVTFPAGCA